MTNDIVKQDPLRLAPVQRNEYGHWSHPDLPDFDENAEAAKAWFDLNRLELATVWLEDDVDAGMVAVEYFEHDSPDISDWHPQPPEGDGWMLISIHDSDEGPAAWFARAKPEEAPVADLVIIPTSLWHAVLMWAYCPKANAYKGGREIENICKHLLVEVQKATGVQVDGEWRTEEETLDMLRKAGVYDLVAQIQPK